MPVASHLLRIEAVNLDRILADTDQLSVIRGGGLMALSAVRRFDPDSGTPPQILIDAADGPFQVDLALISGGASVGLYRFDLPERADSLAQRVVDQVAAHLRADYPHHGFVVDSVPIGDDGNAFTRARERLIARNRLRQLRQPTPVPAGDAGSGAGPCAWDDLRPAVQEQQLKPAADGTRRSVWLSASVHARYEEGRARKQGFLNETTGLDLQYTEDFETLAGQFPQDRRLQNKLAVLYFDGNDFGKLQAGCTTDESLRAFDRYLRDARASLLRGLIEHLAARPEAFYQAPDAADAPQRLRFELLLWGGDEFLFVVPAWLGLSALYHVFEATADWTWSQPRSVTGDDEPDSSHPLTHAGALIFCDRKTPIDRMTQLARDLAEQGVKDAEDGGRDRSRFEYLILESIDFPAEAPAAYFERRYPAFAHRSPLSPVGDAAGLIAKLAGLRDAGRIPHGPLHERALRIARGHDPGNPGAEADALVADLGSRAAAAGPQAEEDLAQLRDNLARLFPAGRQIDAWRWVHLAELWDYLAPRRTARAAGDDA
jgi:hypothetical protein